VRCPISNFVYPINPSSSGPIQFVLDGNNETVTQDTTVPSNSIPLPVTVLDSAGVQVDLATEAKQDAQIVEAQSTNTKLDTLIATDFATETTLDALNTKVVAVDTGAVVVASSALPTGASTLAEQQAQTALLTSIDADTSAINSSISAINNKLAASFFTLPYDKLEVTIKTADGPTRIVSSLAAVTVQTLDIVYDIDGDFESAEVS